VDPILIKRARAAQWACGLCLALLFLLGLSGIASITLLHDDQLYVGNTGGLEGSVLDTVMDLRWLIEPLHEWGGYLAIVLGGWAGLALWRFARHIRRSDRAEWRRTGAWLGPCGMLAGLLVI